jgi:D-alanyl-D-alanine carboxypeptidase
MKRFSLTIRLISFRLVVGYVFALVAAATMIVSCSFGFEETQTIALIEPTAASVTRSMTAAVQTEPTSSVTPSLTATEQPTREKATEDSKPTTPTPVPTSTQEPTPTETATATAIPSPTKAGSCRDRVPSDDLQTLVTSDYAISAEYVPADLIEIVDYLPVHVTLGYGTQLRREAITPLVNMISDMESEGLSPQIISGYRSYIAQSLSWQKWLDREPDRASIISVPPGHSEHQLGTTVDFGSPELAALVGDENIEFHTYFYKTSEGEWLENHAHEYGFTLSYPLEAFEITGFYYEPWHYRYIGIDLASELKAKNISMTQFLLESYPPPCDP